MEIKDLKEKEPQEKETSDELCLPPIFKKNLSLIESDHSDA